MRATCSRKMRLCSARRAWYGLSPRRWAKAVEPSMSVKRMVTVPRSSEWRGGGGGGGRGGGGGGSVGGGGGVRAGCGGRAGGGRAPAGGVSGRAPPGGGQEGSGQPRAVAQPPRQAE